MVGPFTQDAREEAMQAAVEVKGRSLWVDARLRLFRNKAAVVSMIVLAAIVVLAILAPLLSQYSFREQDPPHADCPPTWLIDFDRIADEKRLNDDFTARIAAAPDDQKAAIRDERTQFFRDRGGRYTYQKCGEDILAKAEAAGPQDNSGIHATLQSAVFGPYWRHSHIAGTDNLGRDIWVRTLHGARVSLMVGIVATAVALIIGVFYGATAGFFGGRLDSIMMRFVDVLYALPFIFFVIILMTVTSSIAFFQDSTNKLLLIFIAIGAVEWLTMARIVRGQTLSIRRKEFIEAAVAAGVKSGPMIRRHIIPNVVGPVIVFVTLTIPAIILAESFLSFLGLGTQEPNASWGTLISQGAENFENRPWVMVVPGLFMAVTLFCFNFIGDGLRDALDPKDR
jgi:oligopeptide transport system permease protein